MKIAIYGVSRCGKDYLLTKIIDYLNQKAPKTAYHLRGSYTLNTMSQQEYGRAFKHLLEKEKEILRKKFITLLSDLESEYEHVFVDGHYAFISGTNEYKVVFTKEDRDAYDAFFYLDTPSEMIITFSRNSSGEKKNTTITADEISKWKKFEINQMQSICESLGNELIILDEDTLSCINFIEKYVKDTSGKFSPSKAAQNIVLRLSQTIESSSEIIILDCDKTLSENDVTYAFCDQIGVTAHQLKAIFKNDRYSTYQFYKVAALYGSKPHTGILSSAQHASNQLVINNNLLEILRSKKDVPKIAITSGVYSIWSQYVEANPIIQNLIGCSSLTDFTYLITPQVKRQVVLEMQKQGKRVIAIGDSMIDIPMLEVADQGVIVAHEKLNNSVNDYLGNIAHSKITQLSYSNYKYETLKQVENF